MIYPIQVRAARGLIGISQRELADSAGVGIATVKRYEGATGRSGISVEKLMQIQKALEDHGVIFVSSDENHGVGVRLKNP